MSNPPYRIVIIGVGAIAQMHARAIGDLDDAVLVSGSCRSREKGEAFAAKFGCKWYGDTAAMLDAEKPDVATICTPSGAHAEAADLCFARGVHVICEKPLEITGGRIDGMIERAAKAKVRLGAIFPQRFNPLVAQIHDAAAAGRFGNLAVVASYVPWWRDDAYYAPDRWQGTLALDGGGAMMNQAIHGVDMLQWIAAAADAGPVAEVFGYTAQRGHDPAQIEVEDTAVAVLRFESGALGQLLGATSMYPGSLKRFQVAGRDGTAEVLEDELITWRFRTSQNDDDAVRDRFAAKTATGGGAADPMAIDYANHTRNIGAFLRALRGEPAPAIDGPEARKAVAIIEAIYRSAHERRPVQVE